MRCFRSFASTRCSLAFFFFFFNDTATTEIYTLSLHDALPIWPTRCARTPPDDTLPAGNPDDSPRRTEGDRKSTRLNSSHLVISYAVFCLKKKKTNNEIANATMYNAYSIARQKSVVCTQKQNAS